MKTEQNVQPKGGSVGWASRVFEISVTAQMLSKFSKSNSVKDHHHRYNRGSTKQTSAIDESIIAHFTTKSTPPLHTKIIDKNNGKYPHQRQCNPKQNSANATNDFDRDAIKIGRVRHGAARVSSVVMATAKARRKRGERAACGCAGTCGPCGPARIALCFFFLKEICVRGLKAARSPAFPAQAPGEKRATIRNTTGGPAPLRERDAARCTKRVGKQTRRHLWRGLWLRGGRGARN